MKFLCARMSNVPPLSCPLLAAHCCSCGSKPDDLALGV